MAIFSRRLLFVVVALACFAQGQTLIDIDRNTRGFLPPGRMLPGVTNGQCFITNNGSATWGTCPGGGSGTVTSFSAGNLAPLLFTCSVSNPTTTPTLSCVLNNVAAHKYLGNNTGVSGAPAFFQPVSTELGDFSPTAPTTAGKIPIYDPAATNAAGGTGAYVPGDPLVQGLFADGSTSAANPVAIGGYDTAGTPALHRGTFINGNPAGTEYGIVTRNIPSGTQTVTGSVSVSNFPATQPVSGTVTANQGGTWTVQPGNTANTTAWKVDGSAVTQPVSGTVTANAGTGTFNIQANASVNLNQVGGTALSAANVVDAGNAAFKVNCVVGCGATTGFTDNTAFTAGTTTENNIGGVFNDGLTAVTSGNGAAARITSSRGLHVNLRNNSGTEIGTSGTPVRTDPTGTTTQPISGTVTANAGTGTFTISGTVTANAGTNLNTSALALDATLTGGTTKAINRGGAKGTTTAADVTSTASGANHQPLDVAIYDASGNQLGVSGAPVRIDPTGTTTQPVSGTVTANAGTGTFTVSGTVTSNIGTTNGLALDATVSGTQVAQASTTSGQKGTLIQGAVTTAAPTYTTAQTDPLSLDTSGNLRTSVNNTVTVNNTQQGTASQNVAQFGGTNVSTGTGASGAGIPRVTVSNDSSMVGTLADNGVAAATNRFGVLPSVYQTSYLNGTAATQGRNGALSQGTDGLLWTANLPAIRPASFVASATVSSAASATDIAVMPGNASNTVLLTRVRVTCTQTTAGIITLNLIRRSTADTAGTSSAMTVIQDDTNTSAGVSAPLTYTANPTTGTTVGNMDTVKFGCLAAGTASPNDIYILNRQQKPIVLRGTAQQLAVNLGGTTITGGSFTVTFEWIETATITP